MEIVAEISPVRSPMIELNVLKSPNSEEVTKIRFYKDRAYKHREYGRTDPKAKKVNSFITIDSAYSSVASDVRSRAPEMAEVFIDKNEPLQLRVFIDRSVVEVFVNGRQCVAQRVYPDRKDSVGVSLRSQGSGALLKSLDAWQMKSIY